MDKQSFQVPDLKSVDTVEARNLRLQNLDKLIDQSIDPIFKMKPIFTFKVGWFRTKTVEYKIDYGHPIVSNLSKILLDDIRFKKIDAGDFDIYVNSFEQYLENTWNVNLFRTLTAEECNTFIINRLSELNVPMSAVCEQIMPMNIAIFTELKEKEVPRFQRIKFCLLKSMSVQAFI